jgi:hypothetical protein
MSREIRRNDSPAVGPAKWYEVIASLGGGSTALFTAIATAPSGLSVIISTVGIGTMLVGAIGERRRHKKDTYVLPHQEPDLNELLGQLEVPAPDHILIANYLKGNKPKSTVVRESRTPEAVGKPFAEVMKEADDSVVIFCGRSWE